MTEIHAVSISFDERLDRKITDLITSDWRRQFARQEIVTRDALVTWFIDEVRAWLLLIEQNDGPSSVDLTPMQVGRISEWADGAHRALEEGRPLANIRRALTDSARTVGESLDRVQAALGERVAETQLELSLLRQAVGEIKQELTLLRRSVNRLSAGRDEEPDDEARSGGGPAGAKRRRQRRSK
jgi:hypothetical protein